MIINITRSSVMSIAEGISVIIAQKNGGTPSFEELWASEDERRKLDIYYREAIGDLERKLLKHLKASTVQFSLEATSESDYSLKLTMSRYWPTSLTGLLGNKVQDYMVHSITAGWMNNFSGLTVKEDYAQMAAQDLDDVCVILDQQRFGFSESERQSEGVVKPDEEETSSAEARKSEGVVKPDEEETSSAEARKSEGVVKPDEEETSSAEARNADATAKPEEKDTVSAEARGHDRYKGSDDIAAPRSYRRKADKEFKFGQSPLVKPEAHARKRDNAPVCITHDETDWSGVGMEQMMPDVTARTTGLTRNRPCHPHPTGQQAPHPPEQRYTPSTHKRWYDQLEDMGHQTPPEERRGPHEAYMEKYRDEHEQEEMQEHDCGRAMMSLLDVM